MTAAEEEAAQQQAGQVVVMAELAELESRRVQLQTQLPLGHDMSGSHFRMEEPQSRI